MKMLIELNKLKPNQINANIYDDTDLSDLVTSIEANGQLEPIAINKKNEIISGHRRYFSLVQLGYGEAEVRIEDYENDTIALIEHNRHRVKSVQDILRESKILEKELKTKLGGGQGNRTDLNGGKKFVLVDEMAKSLGYGLSKLKQLRTINNYAPHMVEKIDKEYTLNQAYQIVKEKYLGGKKETKTDFKTSFTKLLSQHSPEINEINSVLKTTYPYNLNYNPESSAVEINRSNNLKKKDVN